MLSVVHMLVTEYLFLQHRTLCVLATCQRCRRATRSKPISANMVYTSSSHLCATVVSANIVSQCLICLVSGPVSKQEYQ